MRAKEKHERERRGKTCEIARKNTSRNETTEKKPVKRITRPKKKSSNMGIGFGTGIERGWGCKYKINHFSLNRKGKID